jgi:hypothetical protein
MVGVAAGAFVEEVEVTEGTDEGFLFCFFWVCFDVCGCDE